MAAGYTIGQLAHAAGVNVETIRYYQRRGLLAQPPRPARGPRRYPPQALARLRFIRQAQALGFSLAEIGRLLDLDEAHCAEVRSVAEAHLRRVRERLAELQRLEAALAALVAHCADNADGAPCPILEILGPPPEADG